jgi:hypothetical protein
MTLQNAHLLNKPLTRDEYFQIIRTGLTSHQYPFVRQAILNWLATYPGDLQAGLYYAQALAGEQRYSLALQVLQGLSTADPESIEIVETLLDVVTKLQANTGEGDSASNRFGSGKSGEKISQQKFGGIEYSARANWFALTGGSQEKEEWSSWGGPVWFIKQALDQRELQLAEELITDILDQESAHPLIGIVHLQFLAKNPAISPEIRHSTALTYHQRWPDTLFCMLYLAEMSLELGQSDYAVALLHQAASRDIGGQVARRMWGEDHPFKKLWPEQLSLNMSLMVPAVVMAILGWNRLQPGKAQNATKIEPDATIKSSADEEEAKPIHDPRQLHESVVAPPKIFSEAENSPSAIGALEQSSIRPVNSQDRRTRNGKSDFHIVENELEKMAARFKLSGITRQDGRFPVYVIFSVRSRLISNYGQSVTDLIEKEMRQLADAVRSRPGWGSMLFFGDDASYTMPIGSKPASPLDPWELKLTLSDLDTALAKQGERIGALLIVGGPEIVPFHLLPNPVDDPDSEIPSDNPYATRDKNYFIPEWPVGRLPGGAGGDARFILSLLRRFQAEHRSRRRKQSFKQRLIALAHEFRKNLRRDYRRSFGYTAEIWRDAAGYVFQPIGRPVQMHVSPPSGVSSAGSGNPGETKRGLNGIPAPIGKLGYFNLHGLVDSPEWFGHRNLLRTSNEPDYPIALRPEDISSRSRKGETPQVIFSEACYGAHVQGRKLEEAICLEFLDAGSQAFAGSTCMAYGSITSIPMVAADLLGHTFWRFLKQGLSAGEALRQAKIYLASEMHRRQSFLDGEDQKTLISFILYGDPLAEPVRKSRVLKSVRYQAKPLAEVRTICDCLDASVEAGPVPAEVMDGVRQAVAKYLPGMSDANLAYSSEHPAHDRNDAQNSSAGNKNRFGFKANGWSQSIRKKKQSGSSLRRLVTLSKQVARHGEIHPEIARLTLDDQGHLIKLVVSR